MKKLLVYCTKYLTNKYSFKSYANWQVWLKSFKYSTSNIVLFLLKKWQSYLPLYLHRYHFILLCISTRKSTVMVIKTVQIDLGGKKAEIVHL